jgi:hypothetical protein
MESDFFDDVDDFLGTELPLVETDDNDWLFVPLSFESSFAVPQTFSAPAAATASSSPLESLPAEVLAKAFAFLEWTELIVLRLCWNRRINSALSLVWPQIAINTWELVVQLPAFECGRLASSLVSSLDRLKRGEVAAAVLKTPLRSLVRSHEDEPATKMARLEPGSQRANGKEAIAAKIIAVMYQSLLATSKTKVEGRR